MNFAWIGVWLTSLGLIWWQALIFVLVFSFVILMLKYDKTKPFWVWLAGRLGNSTKNKNNFTTIIRVEDAKANRKIRKMERRIIKDKLNYSEQQLLEIQSLIFSEYSKAVKEKELPPADYSCTDKSRCYSTRNERESIECNMFHARLEIMFDKLVKSEIRRSFKENGFCDMSEVELKAYIDQQSKTIYAICDDYFSANYERGLILPISELKDIIKNLAPQLTKSIEEMYRYAKDVEHNRVKKIEEYEAEHEQKIEDLKKNW